MSKGPNVICLIRVSDSLGEHWYYAGTPDVEEASIMAIERGFEPNTFTVKAGPNKFGIQHDEWKQAAP